MPQIDDAALQIGPRMCPQLMMSFKRRCPRMMTEVNILSNSPGKGKVRAVKVGSSSPLD
jgi:hypothetical protein